MPRASDAYAALEQARAAWEASLHESATCEQRVADLERAVEDSAVLTLADLLAQARLVRDLAPATGGIIEEGLAASLVSGLERLIGTAGDLRLDHGPAAAG